MGAMLGERFAVEPLAEALEQDPLETHQQLRQLAEQTGLIAVDGEGCRFAHSRYREALLAELPPDVEQAYHRRLLESRHLPEQVRTFHLVQSGDVETSVQALLRDGDQALEWHDWRDALRFYNGGPEPAARWRCRATPGRGLRAPG